MILGGAQQQIADAALALFRRYRQATDIQVLAFTSSGSGPLQGSDDASVTIAVASDAAARIASALETGTITLVRATGATPLHQAAPFEPGAVGATLPTAATP